MDTMEAILARRTVRDYEAAPVPMEHVREMIRAATLAPSGYNRQPWRFVAVGDPALRAKMGDAVRAKVSEIESWPAAGGKEAQVRSLVNGFTVFSRSPMAIAVLTTEYEVMIDKIYRDHGLSFEERFNLRAAPGIQSVAAAIENMILAATSMGYGTCWGTGCLVAKDELEKLLEVDRPWTLVAIVSVGVPKVKPPMPRRKSVDDVLRVY